MISKPVLAWSGGGGEKKDQTATGGVHLLTYRMDNSKITRILCKDQIMLMKHCVFSQARCIILDSWHRKWLFVRRFHEELTLHDN